MNRLRGNNVTLSYGADPIVVDTSIEIEDGLITRNEVYFDRLALAEAARKPR